MSALPEAATLVVARIEAMLSEANRLIERTGAADESAFSLRETERRYLPDTLDAYLNLPPSQRDAVADELLVDQLRLLERATAQRLAALSAAGRAELAANGSFLVERFGPAESLPEATPTVQPIQASPPRALVARLFEELAGSSRGGNPTALLELAGQRFGSAFPALTTVRRGLFGGSVRSVDLTVPRGGDALRYVLEAERGGVVASCTKLVRGVALRTERVELGAWMQGLLEDVSAYVEHDRSARELLTTFLSG